MTFIEELRDAVRAGKVPPIFNREDLRTADIDDPNYNLSNYDKKNTGSNNKKVLVSRNIDGKDYYAFYAFDE